ncbi:aminotransferase class IV [Pseudohaliea rubra]|uniref:Aminodeoxychorismate lyase n=1 Tax=Pseudohaliea rubra DSM 19751 TaxID=1265313 RepID=A0A095XXP6_9GAMM|nr:aminotransferase class IV [Pseudohaliea rubra]KGE04506.1 Branched-chain amino acid aminotransferase [Pseudohaliea rubra DSM 19751]
MSDEPIVFINGEYLPLSAARVSPVDQGFLLGDGVFDVVSAWKGRIFKLEAHLDRFFDSIQAARLNHAMDRDAWKEAIIETTRRNRLADASIRFIVTRGEPDGVVADPRVFSPTCIVWAAPYVFLADEEKRRGGIRLMISATRGFPADTLDPRYKCLDRLHSQLIRLEALEAGYDDALWLDHSGHVSESAASNLFIVKKGVLYTPAAGILRGITRDTVLELASELAIPWQERKLSAFDVYVADEVFTCSTAGGVLPVREVAGRTIQGATPGPITRALDSAYWEMREAGRYGTVL